MITKPHLQRFDRAEAYRLSLTSTYAEVAAHFGVSQQAISKAMVKCRELGEFEISDLEVGKLVSQLRSQHRSEGPHGPHYLEAYPVLGMRGLHEENKLCG